MTGPVYKLHPAEFADYFKHMTRIDVAGRNERFKGASDDASLQAHALRLAISETIVLGIRLDGDIRATIEIMPSQTGQTATAALMVEPVYRGHGLGRRLLEEAVTASRPLGIRSLLFDVNTTNEAMVHLITTMNAKPTSQKGLYTLNLERRSIPREDEVALRA
ncbi:MAG: GNAT family N-acetyltransferase [Pseudomonadota bacterium]